jgi:hypothetical protein
MKDIDIFEFFDELSKGEIISLLIEYDKYIIEWFDCRTTEEIEGSAPVCIREFYDNEFQEIIHGVMDEIEEEGGW